MLGDQFYLKRGIADANADLLEPDLLSVFDDKGFFTVIEFGWTPSYERRMSKIFYLTA